MDTGRTDLMTSTPGGTDLVVLQSSSCVRFRRSMQLLMAFWEKLIGARPAFSHRPSTPGNTARRGGICLQV